MKALVVFDSNFGNTRNIAEHIAARIGNSTMAVAIGDVNDSTLADVNVLIVGSPINAWRPTKKIRDFLNAFSPVRLKGIRAAAFDTRARSFLSGNAAKKISAALQDAGADIIAQPAGFYVEGNEGPLQSGEIKKAEEWADVIKSKL